MIFTKQGESRSWNLLKEQATRGESSVHDVDGAPLQECSRCAGVFNPSNISDTWRDYGECGPCLFSRIDDACENGSYSEVEDGRDIHQIISDRRSYFEEGR